MTQYMWRQIFLLHASPVPLFLQKITLPVLVFHFSILISSANTNIIKGLLVICSTLPSKANIKIFNRFFSLHSTLISKANISIYRGFLSNHFLPKTNHSQNPASGPAYPQPQPAHSRENNGQQGVGWSPLPLLRQASGGTQADGTLCLWKSSTWISSFFIAPWFLKPT